MTGDYCDPKTFIPRMTFLLPSIYLMKVIQVPINYPDNLYSFRTVINLEQQEQIHITGINRYFIRDESPVDLVFFFSSLP